MSYCKHASKVVIRLFLYIDLFPVWAFLEAQIIIGATICLKQFDNKFITSKPKW